MQTTLDHKLAWWIEHRLNVMFRRMDRDRTAKILKTALDQAGLKWSHVSARGATVNQILVDDSIEAFFFDDLDWTQRGFRKVVLDLLNHKDGRLPNLKFVWAAVGNSDDEDELDLDHSGPAQAEAFDVVVVC